VTLLLFCQQKKETTRISDGCLLKMDHETSAQPIVPRHQRWIILLIQLLSSVAVLASFLRIINQQQLSVYFLVFPFSLFLAILITRISFFCVHTSNAIIGLTSGTVAGVLSEVVVDDLMALTLRHESDLSCKFCFLELLHFIVIVCLILYCFYLSCVCTYNLCKIFLFIVSLFSLFIMYVIITFVVTEPLIIELVILFIMMAHFVIFSTLTVPLKLQLWFLWLVMCFMSCRWQMHFLDSLHWDWNNHFHPVPGSAIGLSASFLLSFVMPKYNITCIQRDESLLFATIFHAAAFVVVRILLTGLKTLSDLLSLSRLVWPRSDFWMCTFGLLGCLSLFSKLIGRKLPVYKCFIFIVLIIVAYICVGVVHGLVTNGYFIDEVIALSLVMIMLTDNEFAESDCTGSNCVGCGPCCSLQVS